MCLTCKIISGEVVPSGGILYRDNDVILHHCLDVNIAGYLIVSPVRHVEGYYHLNGTEIQRIGFVTQIAASALRELSDVEKIYISSFGEETPHFHFHIFPRYTWMLNDREDTLVTQGKLDGPKLFSHYREKYKVPSGKMSGATFEVSEYIKAKFRGIEDITTSLSF